VQIGLLDPAKLPVVGVESAKKVLDPSLPANELMQRAQAGAQSTGKKNMSVVGKVESLWRYPVKSMRGEELEEAFAGTPEFTAIASCLQKFGKPDRISVFNGA
jgi:hypothetical protein